MEHVNWTGFNGGKWQEQIDVRDFIQTNYTPYLGSEEFLQGATKRTNSIMEKVNALFKKEREKGGVLDIDTQTVSSLINYAPGYIDKENELIFGMQTDAPLKRGVNPFGGMRMVKQACEAYGHTLSERVQE